MDGDILSDALVGISTISSATGGLTANSEEIFAAVKF